MVALGLAVLLLMVYLQQSQGIQALWVVYNGARTAMSYCSSSVFECGVVLFGDRSAFHVGVSGNPRGFFVFVGEGLN